jgi:hypothetical protein
MAKALINLQVSGGSLPLEPGLAALLGVPLADLEANPEGFVND